MHWRWDAVKDKANHQKHGFSFETAALVFEDPLALTLEDPYPDEERWRTIGRVVSIVMVVHTRPAFGPLAKRRRGWTYHQRPQSDQPREEGL